MKYIITVPGNPSLYNISPMPGWEIIGEIKREGETVAGALVKNHNTGLYAQANAGAIRSLDSWEVERTLKAMEK